jgi:localization factor PodJL
VLRTLRPAESLVGVARVVQQLSRKIDIIGSAGDPAVLEQLEGAIVAMRSVVSHAASHEVLAKLSDEVRALAARLDDARTLAEGRILSSLEARIAMLADQLQARDRSGPNVPDELKVLIERLVDRMERMEPPPDSSAAPARLENLIAKLVEKLDACDARLDQLATIESSLAELLIHIERKYAPTLGLDAAPPPAVEALSREVTDLRQTERQTQDSLEVAHGALAHVVDRLAMIETDMHGKPTLLSVAPPPTNAGAAPLATPAAPKAPLPLDETAAPPATDRYPTETQILPDRRLDPSSGAACGPTPVSFVDRVLPPETAPRREKPPLPEDCGGTSTFIAAARRAAQAADRGVATKNGTARIEIPPEDRSTRRLGKPTALIGGIIIMFGLGVLQIVGFLSHPSGEAEVSAPSRTAATSHDDIAPSPMPGQALGPIPVSADLRAFPVLSPARRQVDIFRYIDGTLIAAPAPVVPGWTLEQLLEAQMAPERWDDATGGVAAAVSAPARRKLPMVGPRLDLGTLRGAQ